MAIKLKLTLCFIIVASVCVAGFYVSLMLCHNQSSDVKPPPRSEQKHDTIDRQESSQMKEQISNAILDRYEKPFKGDLNQIRKVSLHLF